MYLYVHDVLSVGKRGYVSAVGTYIFLLIVLLLAFLQNDVYICRWILCHLGLLFIVLV